MRRPMPITRQRFTLLATAVAALFVPSIAVQAQSFSQSGSNSTSSSSVLTIPPGSTSLDLGTDIVYIGSSGIGSFSALSGAVLNAGALSIASGGTGIGTFTASGLNPSTSAPTTVTLGAGGTVNRLEVGNWGIGTMTVSGGALVDATVDADACKPSPAVPTTWCNNFIGDAAGSTGTLNVTGTGSEVRLIRNVTIGQSSVATNPPSNYVFGTPGGTTNGTVNVTSGGKLSTERATVGLNNHSPDGLGTEKAIGTVTVSGANSQWVLKHNSIDSQSAGLSIGVNAGGTGTVTVSNGGTLLMDGSAVSGPVSGQNDFINLGTSGGKGTLVVTGSGSLLHMAGYGGAITVGQGAGSDGTFKVLAGATASAVFLSVGRTGATGNVVVDGSNSFFQLAGAGNYSGGGTGPAYAIIGWGGTGQTTVSNGAWVYITDNINTSATANRPPGFIVGYTSGSIGTLDISSGGTFQVVSTSITPDNGAPDNFNAIGHIGLNPGSTGTVNIGAGGRLLITGNALSTTANPRSTNFYIGGSSNTAAGGTGTVNISGPGAELRVTGSDPFIGVGVNGTGTLNLSDFALVETGIVNVGRGTTATSVGDGTLLMDNSTMLLNGQQTGGSSPSGAALSIGNRGGTGRATVTNGSVVTINNLGSLGASLNVGGTAPNPLGTGTLELSNGSQIQVIAGSGLASAQIGRDGTGTLTLKGGTLGGSQVDLGDGILHVGRLPTGVGTVTIEGGSKILTGVTNIGGSSDTVAGGTGTMSIQGTGSELSASGASGVIHVGRGGNGILALTDHGKASAIGMSVGRFAGGNGTLVAQDATLEFSGQQTTGNLSGAFLSIGTGGGTGTVALTGSTVTLTNPGSAGASVNVGGSGNFPTGTGTLTMVNSSITLSAGAGLGSVSIGRSGTGSATLSASTIDNVGGNVYVGREAGSTGVLTMTNGSVINAAFVGVGVSAPGTDKSIGPAGGTGTLVLNDSTINASDRFELGPGSTLTGNNGVINVASKVDPVTGVIAGPVVIAGTIAPGNSPGRMRINCDLIMLPGSSIVLEIGLDPSGHIVVDNLILGSEALFDLKSAHIQFSFLAGVNPEVVADAGGLNLDLYLLTATGNEPPVPLSERFTGDQTWDTVVTASNVTAKSTDYVITDFAYNPDTGGATFVQSPVPEPSTWGMLFLGLCAVGAVARRRQAPLSTRRAV